MTGLTLKFVLRFVGLTLGLAGAGAFVTGRAIANAWRSPVQNVAACLGLALTARFVDYALFEVPFIISSLFGGTSLLIVVGVMLDITERTRMESDLRHAATVFDNIAEGVTIAKQDGTVVAVNRAFCTITGYDRVSLQPNAGSQGEFAGLMAIRSYHLAHGEPQRNICLIPASAHGTNAASAVMAGMKVVVVATAPDGSVDLEDLKTKIAVHRERLAAIMVTYPSTHGVYVDRIQRTTVARLAAQVVSVAVNSHHFLEFGRDIEHVGAFVKGHVCRPVPVQVDIDAEILPVQIVHLDLIGEIRADVQLARRFVHFEARHGAVHGDCSEQVVSRAVNDMHESVLGIVSHVDAVGDRVNSNRGQLRRRRQSGVRINGLERRQLRRGGGRKSCSCKQSENQKSLAHESNLLSKRILSAPVPAILTANGLQCQQAVGAGCASCPLRKDLR